MNVAIDRRVVIDDARLRLLKLAGLLLCNDERAEDVVEQALRAAPDWAGNAPSGPAMIGILKARIAEQLRRRSAVVDADACGEDGSSEAIDELFSVDGLRVAPVADWGDAELASSSRAFGVSLEACFDELPPALAQVLLLREWMRYDVETIGRVLDVSARECRERLLHARLRLGASMQRRWPPAQVA